MSTQMFKPIFLLISFPLIASAADLTEFNDVNNLNRTLRGSAKVSISRDSVHVNCNETSLITEYDSQYSFLYKQNKQFSFILIPTSNGYGGVNVFYKLVTVTPTECFLSYKTDIANPVFNESTVESSMRSGYKDNDISYKIDKRGHLQILSERDNYNSFCIQISPKTDIAAIDCTTHKPTIFRTIQQPKTYFYKNHDSQTHSKSYLIKGDKIQVLDFIDGAGRALVTYKGAKSTTTGWIDFSALSEN